MQESNTVLVQHGGVPFFELVQKKYNIEHPISAYLIKPVQRITKYQLLLKELQGCCDEEGKGELKVGISLSRRQSIILRGGNNCLIYCFTFDSRMVLK